MKFPHGNSNLHCMTAWLAATVVLSVASPAAAVVLTEDELEETSTELGVVTRSFGFLLAGETLAPPYNLVDADPTGIGSFDARLYFAHRAPEWKLVAHEQLTLQLKSHATGGAVPIGRGLAPPRWLPLRFEHAEPTLALTSDFDWLYVAYSLGPATFTVGRQPITFGRASVFRTIDRVSTFALTEVDTTYKPGSDALRLDLSWAHDDGGETNVSFVGSIGELESSAHDLQADLRASSFVARAKHSFSSFELGITGGFVRYDAMLGVDAVWDLGPADLYAEITGTRLTDKSLSTPQVSDQQIPVISAVLGATYKPSSEVLIKPEVFYNGFGSYDPTHYFTIATSERVAIGEQTALGKLYLALTSTWQATPLTSVFSGIISNANDPSSLLTLGVQRSLADNVEWVVGGYAPTGHLPDMTQLEARSEYGSYPYFFFTELKGTL